MTYQVRIERHASRTLASLPVDVQRRLAARLAALATDPFRAARKLEGIEGYRVRVGDYRILYTVDESVGVVLVWRVGHRREVYR